MKRKIALVLVLILVLLGATLVSFATDTSDELDSKTSVNVEDLVTDMSEDESDELESKASVNVEDIVGTDSEEDETVTTTTTAERGDLFVVEDEANIKENVDGNLFVIADNVNITGNVDGSIFVIGTNVNINSNITGSAFVLADSIVFNCGQIKDAYFGGKEIDIFEDALISREAKMMADIISIDGTISGDLYSEEEEISVSSTGRITGKLVYSGTLSQATEDSIGSLEKIETDTTETVEDVTLVTTFEKVLTKTFTALVIIGLIVLVKNNKNIDGKLTVKDSVKGVFGGILWIILIPIISLLLIVTVIGIPAALILVMLYVILFFVAFPAASLQISKSILDAKDKDSKVMLWLLGALVYFVLALIREISVIGTIVTILVGTYGFNLIIKSLFSKNKKEVTNKENAVETKAQEDKNVEVKDEK